MKIYQYVDCIKVKNMFHHGLHRKLFHTHVRATACACARACVRACMRVCLCVCVCVCVCVTLCGYGGMLQVGETHFSRDTTTSKSERVLAKTFRFRARSCTGPHPHPLQCKPGKERKKKSKTKQSKPTLHPSTLRCPSETCLLKGRTGVVPVLGGRARSYSG